MIDLEEEVNTGRMTKMQFQGKSGVNKKQQMSGKSLQKKEINGAEHQALETNIKTYITFNKGGKWQNIKAPEKDSQGKTKKCYTE